MKKVVHSDPSPLAGKTVRIKRERRWHPIIHEFAGAEFRVEDWWDRIGDGTWTECSKINSACGVYAFRWYLSSLPNDDEVLYGKFGEFGHLVHTSEIENAQ